VSTFQTNPQSITQTGEPQTAERRGLGVAVGGPSTQPVLVVPGADLPTGPAGPAVVARAARPCAERVSSFQTGVLAAGLGVGGPAVTVAGLLDGDLRALVFPAAIAITLWVAVRREGVQGLRAMLRQPLISRAELPQFLAGAAVTLAAMAWMLGGAW
jgi:hypothetical protein